MPYERLCETRAFQPERALRVEASTISKNDITYMHGSHLKVVAPSAANGDFDFLTAPPTQQRMVGMEECPLHLRKGRLFCLAINAKFV